MPFRKQCGHRHELGAKIFVLWGGGEGVETDACRRADEAIKRLREAVNYLCEYNIERGYGMSSLWKRSLMNPEQISTWPLRAVPGIHPRP
jgi:xylose isomerase